MSVEKYYVDIRFEVEATSNGDALEKTEVQIFDNATYHLIKIQKKEYAHKYLNMRVKKDE